jgi:hypothetical protein
MKRDFGNRENIYGKKTLDKYILRSLTSKTKRDFGFEKSHFAGRDFESREGLYKNLAEV